MDSAALTTPAPAPQSAHEPSPAGTGRFRVQPTDPASFTTHRAARLRHDFQGHPLMQLPRLEQLAQSLMATRQCRFVKPGLALDSTFHHQAAPDDGRDLAEVFRRLEEPGSWIALYNVETDPVYRAFLEGIVDDLRPIIEREQPGIFLVTGFIFISSPPSVTPFHIDRENNFWLQVHGRKSMNVWDHTDRSVVSAEKVDRFIVYGSLSDVKMVEGTLEKARAFDVGPGDGVYFPSTSPHATRSDRSWVRPGDGVSVSIGVNFYTRHTRKMANIHALNLFLRRFGIEPAYPGRSPWRDSLKYPLGRALVWVRKTFRGYKPSVGL